MFEEFDVSRLGLSIAGRINMPNRVNYLGVAGSIIPVRLYIHNSGLDQARRETDRVALYAQDALNNSRRIISNFDWIIGVLWADNVGADNGSMMCDCYGYKLPDSSEWPGNPSEHPWLMKGTLLDKTKEGFRGLCPREIGCGDTDVVKGMIEEPYRRAACKNLRDFANRPPRIKGLPSFIDIQVPQP